MDNMDQFNKSLDKLVQLLTKIQTNTDPSDIGSIKDFEDEYKNVEDILEKIKSRLDTTDLRAQAQAARELKAAQNLQKTLVDKMDAVRSAMTPGNAKAAMGGATDKVKKDLDDLGKEFDKLGESSAHTREKIDLLGGAASAGRAALSGLNSTVQSAGGILRNFKGEVSSAASTIGGAASEMAQATGKSTALFGDASRVMGAFTAGGSLMSKIIGGTAALAAVQTKNFMELTNASRALGKGFGSATKAALMSSKMKSIENYTGIFDEKKLAGVSDQLAQSFGMSMTKSSKAFQSAARRLTMYGYNMGDEWAENAAASVSELRDTLTGATFNEKLDSLAKRTLGLTAVMGTSTKVSLELIKANKKNADLLGKQLGLADKQKLETKLSGLTAALIKGGMDADAAKDMISKEAEKFSDKGKTGENADMMIRRFATMSAADRADAEKASGMSIAELTKQLEYAKISGNFDPKSIDKIIKVDLIQQRSIQKRAVASEGLDKGGNAIGQKIINDKFLGSDTLNVDSQTMSLLGSDKMIGALGGSENLGKGINAVGAKQVDEKQLSTAMGISEEKVHQSLLDFAKTQSDYATVLKEAQDTAAADGLKGEEKRKREEEVIAGHYAEAKLAEIKKNGKAEIAGRTVTEKAMDNVVSSSQDLTGAMTNIEKKVWGMNAWLNNMRMVSEGQIMDMVATGIALGALAGALGVVTTLLGVTAGLLMGMGKAMFGVIGLMGKGGFKLFKALKGKKVPGEPSPLTASTIPTKTHNIVDGAKSELTAKPTGIKGMLMKIPGAGKVVDTFGAAKTGTINALGNMKSAGSNARAAGSAIASESRILKLLGRIPGVGKVAGAGVAAGAAGANGLTQAFAAQTGMLKGIGSMLGKVGPMLGKAAAASGGAIGGGVIAGAFKAVEVGGDDSLTTAQKGVQIGATTIGAAVGTALGAFGGPIGMAIGGYLGSMLGDTLGSALSASPAAMQTITNIGNWVGSVFTTIGSILEPFTNVFGNIFAKFSTVFGDLNTIFTDISDIFVGVFSGDWSKVWLGLTNLISDGFTLAIDATKAIFSIGWETFKAGIFSIMNFAEWIKIGWSNLKMALTNFDWSGAWEGIKAGLSSLPGKIVSMFEGLGTALLSGLSSIVKKAKDFLSHPFDSVKNMFADSPEDKAQQKRVDSTKKVINGWASTDKKALALNKDNFKTYSKSDMQELIESLNDTKATTAQGKNNKEFYLKQLATIRDGLDGAGTRASNRDAAQVQNKPATGTTPTKPATGTTPTKPATGTTPTKPATGTTATTTPTAQSSTIKDKAKTAVVKGTNAILDIDGRKQVHQVANAVKGVDGSPIVSKAKEAYHKVKDSNLGKTAISAFDETKGIVSGGMNKVMGAIPGVPGGSNAQTAGGRNEQHSLSLPDASSDTTANQQALRDSIVTDSKKASSTPVISALSTPQGLGTDVPHSETDGKESEMILLGLERTNLESKASLTEEEKKRLAQLQAQDALNHKNELDYLTARKLSGETLTTAELERIADLKKTTGAQFGKFGMAIDSFGNLSKDAFTKLTTMAGGIFTSMHQAAPGASGSAMMAVANTNARLGGYSGAGAQMTTNIANDSFLKTVTRSAGHSSLNEINAKEAKSNTGIMNNLNDLSGVFGTAKAVDPRIIMTSGFRGASLNAAVGGALHSAHMEGRAMDLQIPGASTADYDALAKKIQANLEAHSPTIAKTMRYINETSADGKKNWLHTEIKSGKIGAVLAHMNAGNPKSYTETKMSAPKGSDTGTKNAGDIKPKVSKDEKGKKGKKTPVEKEVVAATPAVVATPEIPNDNKTVIPPAVAKEVSMDGNATSLQEAIQRASMLAGMYGAGAFGGTTSTLSTSPTTVTASTTPSNAVSGLDPKQLFDIGDNSGSTTKRYSKKGGKFVEDATGKYIKNKKNKFIIPKNYPKAVSLTDDQKLLQGAGKEYNASKDAEKAQIGAFDSAISTVTDEHKDKEAQIIDRKNDRMKMLDAGNTSKMAKIDSALMEAQKKGDRKEYDRLLVEKRKITESYETAKKKIEDESNSALEKNNKKFSDELLAIETARNDAMEDRQKEQQKAEKLAIAIKGRDPLKEQILEKMKSAKEYEDKVSTLAQLEKDYSNAHTTEQKEILMAKMTALRNEVDGQKQAYETTQKDLSDLSKVKGNEELYASMVAINKSEIDNLTSAMDSLGIAGKERQAKLDEFSNMSSQALNEYVEGHSNLTKEQADALKKLAETKKAKEDIKAGSDLVANSKSTEQKPTATPKSVTATTAVSSVAPSTTKPADIVALEKKSPAELTAEEESKLNAYYDKVADDRHSKEEEARLAKRLDTHKKSGSTLPLDPKTAAYQKGLEGNAAAAEREKRDEALYGNVGISPSIPTGTNVTGSTIPPIPVGSLGNTTGAPTIVAASQIATKSDVPLAVPNISPLAGVAGMPSIPTPANVQSLNKAIIPPEGGSESKSSSKSTGYEDMKYLHKLTAQTNDLLRDIFSTTRKTAANTADNSNHIAK